MEVYWFILFFVVGVVIGSFFNVVGLRVPQRIPFSNDRSYCPSCQKQLKSIDLIPIFSYLFLRGKCRHCQTNISILYPIIEILTGFLFAFSYWKLGLSLELITVLIFISMLMILFVSDLTYMLIPNKILLFFLPLLIIMRIISPLTPWYDAIIGAVVGYVVLALIIILSKGGMGGGDMKLFGVIGIIIGWKGTLLTLFLASLLGLFVGGTMILFKKQAKKEPIPFGPYIIVAAIISYFYGDNIIAFYMEFF